jgi:hypothetical protein
MLNLSEKKNQGKYQRKNTFVSDPIISRLYNEFPIFFEVTSSAIKQAARLTISDQSSNLIASFHVINNFPAYP